MITFFYCEICWIKWSLYFQNLCSVITTVYSLSHNSVCLKHTVGLWTSGSCQGVSRFYLCFVALLPITHAVKSVGLKCEIQCIVYHVWENYTQQFKFNAEVSEECLLLILALSITDTEAETFLLVILTNLICNFKNLFCFLQLCDHDCHSVV